MTVANGLCGFAAVVVLLGRSPGSGGWGASLTEGRLGVVLALVGCGMACDALDGVVARRRGASGLGGHLDLMSDAVTFGIVPALLLIQSPAAEGPAGAVVAAIVGGLYFCAVVVRLALFADGQDHEHGFTGLPSPASALAVLALLVLAPGAVTAFAIMALLALLMVSPYPWPHPGALGMTLLTILALTVLGLVLAGWLPPGPAAIVAGGATLLVGPLHAALRGMPGRIKPAGFVPARIR